MKREIKKREIKYRAKKQQGNHEWLYGSHVCYAKNGEHEHYILNNGKEMLSVMPETIGQFTGLLDKNGKEVYENDIVISNIGRTFLVVWRNSDCGFFLNIYEFDINGNKIMNVYNHMNRYEIEVIGNLHDKNNCTN